MDRLIRTDKIQKINKETMIRSSYKWKEHFAPHTNNHVLINGSACNLLVFHLYILRMTCQFFREFSWLIIIFTPKIGRAITSYFANPNLFIT